MELTGAVGGNEEESAQEPVILPFEDRIRMTRLYEEVLTRLEEMAMITARTLKLGARLPYSVKFAPQSAGNDPEFAEVELLSTPQGSGCYDYLRGACFAKNPRQGAQKSKSFGGSE